MPQQTPETDALEKSFNRLTQDSDTAILLINVEDRLRETGKADLAERLNKLQVDIAGYYAGAEDGAAGGELSKPFIDGYEKLTIPRVKGVMTDIDTALKGDGLAAEFGALAKDVRTLLDAAQPAAKPRPAAASIKPK